MITGITLTGVIIIVVTTMTMIITEATENIAVMTMTMMTNPRAKLSMGNIDF